MNVISGEVLESLLAEAKARQKRMLIALCGLPVYAAAVFAIIALSGCTMVRYTDGQKSLTIADIRISGSAIDLDATLNNVGKLSVNREQGSQGEAVSQVVESLPNGVLLDR
jgi:hypothetical protein